MNPSLIISTALAALDQIVNLIKHVRGQGALTDDELSAQIDKQNLQNSEDIKGLLAL